MEIFGVGPLEFLLFLVLALVILGPEDMVGTARKIGQWVYRVVRSPTWRAILETSQDLRDLPSKIVRDAGLEETMKEIKQTADEVKTDLSDTTRELTAEMQAATSEVTREMQTAVQDANAGMNEAGAEAQIAMQGTSAGLSGGENTIAPPQAQAAVLDEAAPASEKEPRPDPYEVQLETIATGLGGKVIQHAEPEALTALRVTPAENTVPTAPAAEPQAEAAPKPPYEAGLETFAQALGAPSSSPQGAARPDLENQAPVETEPAPPSWAIGIPAGLNLDEGGMEARFKKQMDEMRKSIEKLDAKIMPAGEEGVPPSGQAAPPGNGGEPGAAPTRVRRSAKRTAPAVEANLAEAPKAAPRKRAVKTALPSVEADLDAAPKAAPRKRAVKTTSPAAEAVEGEAPRITPRTRTPKKTTAPETAE